jgi:hypothetical protein
MNNGQPPAHNKLGLCPDPTCDGDAEQIDPVQRNAEGTRTLYRCPTCGKDYWILEESPASQRATA